MFLVVHKNNCIISLRVLNKFHLINNFPPDILKFLFPLKKEAAFYSYCLIFHIRSINSISREQIVQVKFLGCGSNREEHRLTLK